MSLIQQQLQQEQKKATPPKQRKYQSVWERLKSKQKVTLEVMPAMVARVKKAIIKEKHKDVGFKVMNDHDNFFLDFSYAKETQRLVVKLKQTLGLEGVKGL